jgi:hypothetical protein
LRKKHQKTLAAIFSRPTRPDIKWAGIESLMVTLGPEVIERQGSRAAIILKGHVGHFHRPHPQKETDKGTVSSVRTFLRKVGIEP